MDEVDEVDEVETGWTAEHVPTTGDDCRHEDPHRAKGEGRGWIALGAIKSRPLLLSGDLSSEHEERWKALRHRALEDAGTFSPFRTRNAA